MNAEVLAGNIAAHWVQAAVIAISALLALRLLRLHEPRAKLAALHGTLVAIILLPFVQPWPPDEPSLAAPSDIAMDAAQIAGPAEAMAAPAAARQIEPALAVVMLIASGIVIRLTWLFYGIVRLARFSRSSPKVKTPEVAWPLESELAVSPRYLQLTAARCAWTFGFIRPTVALPAGFDALVPAFQRSVICHELVHVKRRDMTIAFLEELAVAALWFHPWIWLVRARIRVTREQVVDRRVIALLGNAEEYVRCLVDMSGHDLAPHFSQTGAGMLRPRELRARVDAIFEEVHMSRMRVAFAAVTFAVVVVATGFAGVAAIPLRSVAMGDRSLPIALQVAEQTARPTTARLNPAASTPINLQFKGARLRDVLAFIGQATSIVFTGYEDSFDDGRSVTIAATIDATSPVESVLDRLLPPNGLTYTVAGPRAVVIAKSPQAQPQPAPDAPRAQINMVYPEYPPDALARRIRGTVVVDVTVNAAGQVTTAAVASGPQELRASAFTAALQLRFTKGSSTTAMKIAFEYLLTGTSWGVTIKGAPPNIATQSFIAIPLGKPETRAIPINNPDESGAYRVGGAFQPPKKLKDAAPIYPAIAQAARVQGIVVMDVRIDEQGMVSDVRTLKSIPLLDEAAMDAVRQWQYTPTLLNGVAVPVLMTVTVSFTLRPQARIQVMMPDGNATELRAEVPTQVVLGDARFHLVPSRLEGSPDLKVSVYGEDGQTHLGDVVLVPDGSVVQSPTTPSFGMRFLLVP